MGWLIFRAYVFMCVIVIPNTNVDGCNYDVVLTMFYLVLWLRIGHEFKTKCLMVGRIL